MKAFANLSIRNKLIGIILLATLVPLALGFYVVLRESRRAFEQQLLRSTALMTEIIGAYSAIALYFDDPEISGLELIELQGERVEEEDDPLPFETVAHVTNAIIFDEEGEVFSEYYRPGKSYRPESLPRDSSTEIRDGHVHSFAPISHEGERRGTIFLRVSNEALDEIRAAFVRSMAWLLAGLMIFAVVLAWGLQRVISKPILRLAAAARRISDEGDYSLRTEKPGNDEIGHLYDGFNAMLDQIEQRQGELERSNRDLDQFAHVASHDLKAPLRAIANLSAWLSEDHDRELGPQGQEKLDLLRQRVARMGTMIDGILEYSRFGRSDSAGEPVDVGRLLRELIEMLDRPPGMTIAITTPMPTLVTRPLRLQQVFANLITNAIRYHDHPDHGRVEIAAEALPEGGYAFTVADDGPGIAPEHHETIFRMFQTVGDDHPESTGLGLSLVKKLVEDEGGTIRLRSARGVGASFRFTWHESLAES